MRIVDFGQRSGLRIPVANIGAMRLPRDAREAVSLLRHAIDSGMRYIDTSRGYGESEWLVGRALRGGYREKVILSSKWSAWNVLVSPDDSCDAKRVRRRIEESLLRLGVDYLDYYQVWNINNRENYDKAVAAGGMVEAIEKAIEDGLVRRSGFTTHDSVENIIEYTKEANWCDVILFTYNILNRNYAPAMEAAHSRGIATLVMNPVCGGALAEGSAVLDNFARRVGARDASELSIRYILSNPCVTGIISGIRNHADVDNTIAAAEKKVFSKEEMNLVDSFLDSLSPAETGFCTGCRYCLPCEAGIDIPAVMSAIDLARNWNLRNRARWRYNRIQGQKADACTGCRACEKKCTQNLPISREMGWAARELAGTDDA